MLILFFFYKMKVVELFVFVCNIKLYMNVVIIIILVLNILKFFVLLVNNVCYFFLEYKGIMFVSIKIFYNYS